MRNILVLAYAISPTKGSEYSVAWNYMTEISKENQLTIIYGTSGKYMGDCSEMEKYAKYNPISNVNFIPIYPNRLANLLNWPNRHHFFIYTFYYAYKVWHKLAYKKALKLIKSNHYDLIHYIGPIGYREPGYLWKLPLPYVWGPIGGFNNIPTKMMKALPLSGKMKLGIRALINNIQMHTSKRVRSAINRTDILMTCTSENKKIVHNLFHRDTIYLPENGIINLKGLVNLDKFKNERLSLIWIGRIDSRKALIILLDALSHLKDLSKVELHIVGDGPLKKSLMKYCNKKGLNNSIIWHGMIPRKNVYHLLTFTHFLVVTSVSEGNPTTIWEAMSVGVPILTVDHCGMHDIINEQCGIKIPITDYKKIVHNFSNTIEYLIIHREKWHILARGTVERAKKYTWEKRKIFLNKIYDNILDKH